MTGPRRVIARVLSESDDHPDVETVYARVSKRDSKIGLATVYRTLRLFEEAKILERHDFGDGRARYEEATDEHHDHLIDIKTGEVIEFQNEEIEAIQRRIAEELGYELVDHRLELFGTKLPRARSSIRDTGEDRRSLARSADEDVPAGTSRRRDAASGRRDRRKPGVDFGRGVPETPKKK
jgi:Fur family ferric uptake transcriptional regulator